MANPVTIPLKKKKTLCVIALLSVCPFETMGKD